MIRRLLRPKPPKLLRQFPAVALLEPRQAGKTTFPMSLALANAWLTTTPSCESGVSCALK